MATTAQPGILLPLPAQARYLSFELTESATAAKLADALRALRELADGERTVIGVGAALSRILGVHIPGLRDFPPLNAPGLSIATPPDALWVWLRGDDRGEILHRSRRLTRRLAPSLRLRQCVDAFTHAGGRDLSGYEDGTENPTGDEATAAALVGPEEAALAGSSFVATQRWRHDFDCLADMSEAARDHAVGRRREDNEELDEAPAAAHVKRTAQESFTPEAFVLRRSMPWAQDNDGGLMFVAFGKSFAAFEAQLRRMVGAEDGVVDALFRFTRPESGAYFWCPAMRDGALDLAPLGL